MNKEGWMVIFNYKFQELEWFFLQWIIPTCQLKKKLYLQVSQLGEPRTKKKKNKKTKDEKKNKKKTNPK